MDPKPALPPLTVDEHVHAPGNPGGACLAMALSSLGLASEPSETLDALAVDASLSPDVRALEALQHGAHAILHGPTDDTRALEQATTAGVVVQRQSPGTRDVLAALEARRPALVPVGQAPLGEGGDSRASCILALQDEEEIVYHDPHRETGPDAVPWETLANRFGYRGHRWMLELAKPPREG